MVSELWLHLGRMLGCLVTEPRHRTSPGAMIEIWLGAFPVSLTSFHLAPPTLLPVCCESGSCGPWWQLGKSASLHRKGEASGIQEGGSELWAQQLQSEYFVGLTDKGMHLLLPGAQYSSTRTTRVILWFILEKLERDGQSTVHVAKGYIPKDCTEPPSEVQRAPVDGIQNISRDLCLPQGCRCDGLVFFFFFFMEFSGRHAEESDSVTDQVLKANREKRKEAHGLSKGGETV